MTFVSEMMSTYENSDVHFLTVTLSALQKQAEDYAMAYEFCTRETHHTEVGPTRCLNKTVVSLHHCWPIYPWAIAIVNG